MSRTWFGLSSISMPRRSAPARLVGRLCAVILVGVVAGNASADETMIETLSLAQIPEFATVEIRLPVEEGSDDLQLSVILASEFAIVLTELGHGVVERGGELLFRFAAEEPTYAQAPGTIEFVRASVGNTTVSQSDPDTFRLRVGVARPRKPPLWTGFIERSVRGGERREVYVTMANEIMKFWGTTHAQ